MQHRIYLDHNATAPLHLAALEAMQAALVELHGNPSSIHRDGQRARAAVEEARREVARALGASLTEVVFTSGASEANNLALQTLHRALPPGRAIASSVVEHPSVLAPLRALEAQGRRVVWIDVDPLGRLPAPDALAARFAREDVGAASLMLANNEIGACYDLAALTAALEGQGVWLHTDATQAIGRIPVSFGALGVHLLSLSGHKLGGPKGVGALIADPALTLAPLLLGGHQERGRRGGTENVPAIVGLGAAARVAIPEALAAAPHLAIRRDRLWAGIQASGLDACRQGDPAACLPNTLSVRFGGVDGETLLMNLDLAGISVSAGAACSAGSLEPSHVVLALGVPPEQARGAVRFSLGPRTTDAEIDATLDRLPAVVARSRIAP